MTPLRITKGNVINDLSTYSGMIVYDNGVAYEAIFFIEWSWRAKDTYDSPETYWKVVPYNGMPTKILDGDGNEA